MIIIFLKSESYFLQSFKGIKKLFLTKQIFNQQFLPIAIFVLYNLLAIWSSGCLLPTFILRNYLLDGETNLFPYKFEIDWVIVGKCFNLVMEKLIKISNFLESQLALEF